MSKTEKKKTLYSIFEQVMLKQRTKNVVYSAMQPLEASVSFQTVLTATVTRMEGDDQASSDPIHPQYHLI
jgi:hypothetical protein